MYQIPYHAAPLSAYSFLVTGGAGFIGSNIVEYLLKHGAGRVVVLDNLCNGFMRNLADFEANPAFTFLEGDTNDAKLCARACEGIDFISHQAALGSVPRSVKDPVASNEANVNGGVQLLKAAVDAGVKRVVYASSSAVYGDDPTLPKLEHKTGQPLSPYAVSKVAGELYAQVFHKAYGLETVGFRYFNVFGPRQNPDLTYAAVIPLFAKAILNGNAPTIFSDGEQSRDFTFIENIVQANVKAMFASHPDLAGSVLNIGNGETTTVNMLAEIINELAGTTVEAEHLPPRLGDIRNSLADIAKAKTLIGYEPQFSFRQGLELTIHYYKELFVKK
jgi:UDP-N-acetylglucosamine/UDP-N-acetylgalactosamine 4-epimerase